MNAMILRALFIKGLLVAVVRKWLTKPESHSLYSDIVKTRQLLKTLNSNWGGALPSIIMNTSRTTTLALNAADFLYKSMLYARANDCCIM